jgi:hypothetical protein
MEGSFSYKVKRKNSVKRRYTTRHNKAESIENANLAN